MYLYSAQESGVNLANFICRRCIKTGSDKTPTGCASKLETVRRFGTVPTTLLPLYFRDDAYNLRLIERVTIEWEFFRWILLSLYQFCGESEWLSEKMEQTNRIVSVRTSILKYRGHFRPIQAMKKMQYSLRTFQNLRAQAVATPCRAFLSYLGLP